MRVAIVVIGAILLVIFLGGAVNLGSEPLFGHIDSALKTNALMKLHYSIFSFIHRGGQSASDGYERGKSDIDDMARKAEFGKRQHYNRLDKAKEY